MVVAKKHHELYEELGSIVGSKYVSDDLTVLTSYTRDMSPMPPGKPQGVVVRPGSLEEVVELVRLANQTRTPLIPIGGKATISGVPPGQPGRGILVDMKRMDKVIDIDEANMAVTAQCGITLGELIGKVNERGWAIPTASQPTYSDTVGGQLSGYPCGGVSRYGFSTGGNSNWLLGIKVVLPNGSVVDTGTGEGSVSTYQGHTWARARHGPDLAGMFIGDGGIFGIKVEATYRMFRPPKFQKICIRCWDNLDELYKAFLDMWEIDPFIYAQPYGKMIIQGPEVACLMGVEPTWSLFWRAVGNSEEEVELKIKTGEAICDKYGGRVVDPVLIAFTENLEDQPDEMGRLATLGPLYLFEFIVSRRDHLEAYKWARECFLNVFKKRGILTDLSDVSRLKTVALALPFGTGSGVIDITPFYDQNDRELDRAVQEAFVEFLEQARHRGYVIEGTQGYQSRLKAQQWTGEFYNYVSGLKKYLDPNNIMNPGVFFP